MGIGKFLRRIFKKVRYRLLSDTEKAREDKLRRIENAGYAIESTENRLMITMHSGTDVALRKIGSDVDVFFQIFVKKEYEVIIDFIRTNQLNTELIVDCGGNIGLTSLILGQHFPHAKIYCVEPDEDNYTCAKANNSGNPNILHLNNAIWSTRSQLSMDRSFRDGQDWSIRTLVKETAGGTKVQSLTVADVLAMTEFVQIDLLKIDVEGAESALFENYESASFLTATGLIAIEIHDEFGQREKIYDVLRHYGFMIFNSGELTIGYRR